MIMVTGGAGFIGANFVHRWLSLEAESVLVLDKLTYAGNLANLTVFSKEPSIQKRLVFTQGDINDRQLVLALLMEHRPRAIVHFAAETHVDRAISDPYEFVRSNVSGTFELFEAIRAFMRTQSAAEQTAFRVVHISTDEVFGSLQPGAPAWNETASYAPRNPYAATKAAADHVVNSYWQTYRVPSVIVRSSNNYGPYQFPEKLIPRMVSNALLGDVLPIYGNGQQIRDWLHVSDCCEAITHVMRSGRLGESYNVAGGVQVTNIKLVTAICSILDSIFPKTQGSYADQIGFVTDRLGHDLRYELDCRKILGELCWQPQTTFDAGLYATVKWYVENQAWLQSIRDNS